MLIDYVLKYSGEMFIYVRCLYFGLEFDFHMKNCDAKHSICHFLLIAS